MVNTSAADESATSTIVGIDEAGYGPLLGPLVVSAVAFDVPVAILKAIPQQADGPDLWKLLQSSVSRKASKRDPRLAVADSKKLHKKSGSAHGLELLERAAMTFLAQTGDLPATWRDLLRQVCPGLIDQLENYPWYDGQDFALPVDCSRDGLATQCNALASSLQKSGIRFRGAWVECLPVIQFNRMVNATRNKAIVLFGCTTRLIQRIADGVGPRPLRIWIDRQGGRVTYRRALMTAFEDAQLDVLEESPERSGYRLTRSPAPCVIRFVKEGETHHLPIALASIFSKYTRELFMRCFNRYWQERVPGLKPTAGYYQDGQRFLADIEPVLRQPQQDRTRLVRDL